MGMYCFGEHYTLTYNTQFDYATITRQCDGQEVTFVQGDEAGNLWDQCDNAQTPTQVDLLLDAYDYRDER